MPRKLDGDLALSMAACSQAGGTAETCEKVFQSALFEPADAGKVCYLAAGLADLFAARWLDQQLAAARLNCAGLLKYPQLLQRGDVFAYLMGQPNGPPCAMPLVDDRCSRNPKSDQIEVLDQGLPAGKPRVQIIKHMHTGYEATHWKYCAQKTLKGLDASVGGCSEPTRAARWPILGRGNLAESARLGDATRPSGAAQPPPRLLACPCRANTPPYG